MIILRIIFAGLIILPFIYLTLLLLKRFGKDIADSSKNYVIGNKDYYKGTRKIKARNRKKI